MTAVAVPDRIDVLLSPEWLTTALAPRYPGVHVRTVTRGPVVERMSTNARFRIEGDLPDDLCPDLCAKGYYSEVAGNAGAAGEPEARFYRDLAADTGVRTLRPVWADVDPTTHHGVVITEDVIAAGGEFRDALSPCTPDDAAAVLGELARLHAHGWERVDAVAPWLVARAGGPLNARGLKEITGNFESEIGEGVPEPVRDAQLLVDGFRAVAAREEGAGWTIVHGDMHVGNTFVDGDRQAALLDWQLVQRGHWSTDVAYHVGSALESDVRAANERELLRHYLDRLAAEGVRAPSFDDAWEDYRRAMPYGFFLWGITLFVARPITAVLCARLGTATYELGSYASLGVA